MYSILHRTTHICTTFLYLHQPNMKEHILIRFFCTATDGTSFSCKPRKLVHQLRGTGSGFTPYLLMRSDYNAMDRTPQ